MSNTGVYDAAPQEGTEMQQVDCFNIWELNASSTLPAALLHPSDEQQVG